MDEKTDGVLHKVLTSDELTQVPHKIKEKLDNYFTGKFEEFLIRKAEGETAKATLDEVRDKLETEVTNLKSQIQDYEAKLKNAQQNSDELRQQLDSSRLEMNRLVESVKRFEAEANECRRDKNAVVDERDSLLKMNERRNAEVERLQSDLKSLEQQLKNAVHAKCDALAKIDEIQAKEINLDFKEKRMEQERTILTSQIQSLTEDLNRTNSELHSIRRDNNIRNLELDTKINERTEELKICNSQIAHLNETVGVLTAKAEDLATKLLQQSEESNKMMDYYKKELHAKTKLADLYKETNEDKANQLNELLSAITDLKKMLSEATDQYGELETKLKAIDVKHEQELDEKNNVIQALRDELKTANEILKESQSENLENAIGKLAPTAAVTSKLIKFDMSLTELYSKYVKATEELQLQEKENQKLNLTMKSIMQELEENAPIIRRQALDYQKVLEANQELQTQLEKLITEKVDGKQEMDEALRKVGHLERENKKLKVSQADLARQVCYLLGEVEQARGGLSLDKNQSLSTDATSDEVISKRLVTFNSINELQENNQKLLLLVRDLSSKLEEMEEIQNNIDQASYEAKINNYSKRLNEMQQSLEHQSEMLNISMQKCDRYKKLYYDSLKLGGKGGFSGTGTNHHADGSIGSDHMDGIDEETPIASTSSVISNEISNKEKRIVELEDLIKEMKEQIKTLKQEHEEYVKEKKINEKMLNEQFDSMRSEVRELTSKNCQLLSQVQYNNEQIKLAQKNAGSYKKQISSLEDRNKNYESTIIKHEQTIVYLKDETLNTQKKLSHAEVQLQNLRQECRILKDAEARLQMEREALHRERQTQSLLMNNLEMIKATFERSESEGRIRLESRVDEANRECSALRRRLQEEQDNFRELAADLKRQTDSAKDKMEEEKAVADKYREEIASLRSEIKAKTAHIDELSKKLQESLTPSKNDNPIVKANKRARDFELKYEEVKLELESLQKTLEQVREHSNQYCKLSQSSEKELADLSNAYTEYKMQAEDELNRLRLAETNYKSRVEELETEIQLQITDAQLNTGTTHYQVKKVQSELKETLQKLAECNRELRDLREKNNILTASLQGAEQKYANELASHTSDIQELVKLREEVLKVREQIEVLTSQRDKAVSILEETKHNFIEGEKRVIAEKDELEKRLIDLDAQNSLLHNQIQSLTLKISSATGYQSIHEDSMNDHSTVCDSSLLNKSVNEDDVSKYSDKQLLQIIKYLRREKDIAFAKVDILKSENNRLISEQQILQKRINELNSLLNTERTTSESTVITASRHEEILRKVETLNAVTDSNRILREERDALSNRVKELLERVTKVEDELFPLQEENRELKSKVEEFTAEITSLRTEAVKWRSRANTLIEKSNKNPEEFKRIQNERESLAKMLTAEKENIKHLQEDIQTLRSDKTKVDADIQGFIKQVFSLNEEKKKVADELNSFKQINARLNHEIMDMRNNVLQKEEELRKVTEEVNSKETQLNDSKNKEVQIRKIAKKYKDLYFELKTKTDGFAEGESSSNTVETQPGSEGTTTSAQEDKEQKENKINELNNQLKQLEEEADRLRKENDEIKSNAEKEDRTKTLLREAKLRIMNLTEAKNSVTQELNTTKNQLQSLSQSLDQEYVEKAQLEKALTEQDNQLKERITMLTRENESLLLRVSQLNRQLGLQQSSKPSTSSGTGSDKGSGESPRTANVKPMAGPSGQQSATVTPWRGSSGETPLASIRPMSVSQNSRTAAILPTSQTGNVASVSVQGTSSSSTSTSGSSSSSSTASVTALVPPQQQCHTTAGNNSGEAMSSSPTSSHTDYMPATSSAAVIVATIPPLSSAESSQEAESIQQAQSNADTAAASTSSSNIAQQILGQQQQQAVALVSPRVEGNQNIVAPQIIIAAGQSQQETNNQQPSTSGTSGGISGNVSVSSHHQASSSNTVTTTQAGTGGHKRPRADVEGDSSSTTEETPEKSQPQNKRTRLQAGEATASLSGVSESGLEVEYQVPTSSQRDQEDDIIIVDSEEEGDETDDGNADVDDGPMEDEVDDNGEGYEIEEGYEVEQDIDENEAAGGPNIDEMNTEDNNEVDVDEENSSQIPNQSAVAADAGSSTSQMAPAEQSGTSSSITGIAASASTSATTSTTSSQSQVDKESNVGQQQIQAISSGSSEAVTAGSSSTEGIPQTTACWRQNTPLSRQQQQTLLMLQQGLSEEDGDDCIVPSTPTLYVPRRSDGNDAVSSPHTAQVPSAARFTFVESASGTPMASEADDSSRVLNDETNRSVPTNTTQQAAASDSSQNESASTTENVQASTMAIQDEEPVAGPSNSVEMEENINTMVVTEEVELEDEINESASQSEVQDLEQHANEEIEIEEGEGIDGVSSEGEKTTTGTEEVEEGREAEATTSPTINTRSRSVRGAGSNSRKTSLRGTSRTPARPTPIVWSDGSPRGGPASGNRSPQRNYPAPNQRSQRARRMRRPTGPNFGRY